MGSQSWHVSFGPTDPINPGCGYQIQVEKDGVTLLRTGNDPVTGERLDYAACLEIAAMYGPNR